MYVVVITVGKNVIKVEANFVSRGHLLQLEESLYNTVYHNSLFILTNAHITSTLYCYCWTYI